MTERSRLSSSPPLTASRRNGVLRYCPSVRSLATAAVTATFTACGGSTGECAQPTGDSVRIVAVALDAVRPEAGFASIVFRFEPISDGVRVVTVPDPDSAIVNDGMAAVVVDRDCKVSRLIRSDSL